MKSRILIFFGLLVLAPLSRAQDGQPANYDCGWYLATNAIAPASDVSTSFPFIANPTFPGGASAIAENSTADISALARNLDNDPTRIFNYVHDHIRYVHYFGSHKGAEMTLLERSGNDFDQCALLVALLQAAGISANYEFGIVSIPYTATNQQDYQHWVGLTLPNTNWTNAINLAVYINGNLGYPFTHYFTGDTNNILMHHVWVQATVNGTNCTLDPSFKVSLPISGLGLDSAMQLDTNTLLSGVSSGSTATADYVEGLNEGNLRSTLTSYNSNLLSYIQGNYPNYSVPQIVGGQSIVPSTGQPLGQATPFTVQTQGGQWPVSQWTNIPTGLMAVLTVNLPGTNNSFYMPGLAGNRLSIVCTSNGVAQLWQEDTLISSVPTTGSGSTFTPTLGVQHPYGTNWDFTIPGFSPARYPGYDQSVSGQTYQRTNATYVLLYGLDANAAWLTERQQKLDSYREQGYADSSQQVMTETLNVMGLGWLTQTELAHELLAGQTSTLSHFHHRLGRMAEETGRGYYIDVYEQVLGVLANNTTDATGVYEQNQMFQISSYFDSAMEHGIIEQLQNKNLVGASTVKLLELASTNSQKIYLASSTNWSTGANVSGNITSYDSSGLYANFISQGYLLLLPHNGSIQINGSGSWAGAGYVAYQAQANGTQISKMIIGGGYNGGYVDDPTAVPDPTVITTIDQNQANFFNLQSATISLPTLPQGDPVNPVDGSFQINSTDLSLGGAEPRGLNLSRFYSSARRNSNPAGMAPGWLHNYYCTALPTSAPLAGLGGTTPQQMVPMMVATRAALNIYNSSQPSAKSWVITALIAKWGIDQLIANAVSVNLGNATVQFVKQPDGSYTPPANCTMSLIKTNSTLWLLERHGRTFKFNSSSFLTDVVDQYGQGLTLAYNSSNWVSSVTDWQSRKLTFNYSGTPSRLVSVTNNNSGRQVSYGYTTNANSQLDLTSVTDPEGKTTTFGYDANHQAITTFNALTQLVVTNIYDGFGRVTTQYTQGDTSKMWQVFCSGFNTLIVDPAGGIQETIFDDKSRQTGSIDALGNLSQTYYDGQDRVVMTVSPLNETNQCVYDGNNNLVQTIDPLGFSNTFVFDSQNNLVQSVDTRGNSSYFGYNAKFQLTGSTNGAGDWVTNNYDSTTGLLTSRTDSAGSTSFSYDSLGQLKLITYPGSLGSEGFLNSANGDVLSHTNSRGFITSFSYNLRRQLTNTVAPTNLTTSITYDAVGNVAANMDALGNSTGYNWSPTRHLLSTTCPTSPQGTPVVTNIYDNRDWLIRSLDPLQHPTTNSYDLAKRLLSVTDPLLRTTSMTYDNDGRKLTITNAAMEGIVQQWDVRGFLTNTVDQLGKNISWGHDPAGNPVMLTNRNGHFWQCQFDAANHLTNTISPLSNKTFQVWNNRGLLQSVTDPKNQTTAFGYDARGRKTSLSDTLGTNIYQYDANNNLTNIFQTNSPLGVQSLQWGYDAYDRLIAYTNDNGDAIQYRYDKNGNLTSLIYPGDRTVTYAYDNLNRLTTVTDWTNRVTTYTYDLNSRVTSITRPNGTVCSNFYDVAGQLTNIIEQAASHAPIAFFKLNFNSAARVQWEFMAPTNQPYTPPTRTMLFDADNRLTNFNSQAVINDNDGNMTSGPLTNNTLSTYSYDARNRLLSAGGLDYAYDPANNRTSITNGSSITQLVISPNGSQVLMRVKGSVTNYYVYGLGLLYEEDDTATSTNTLTYHYDYRGSTVALTDGGGNVTDRIQYSAYGMVTYRTGTSDTPFQFNGRYGVQTDPNGLLYMRARYYNPYICRFLNADPSGFAGGLNFYAFCGDNPISQEDPFGLGYWSDVGQVWVGYGQAGIGTLTGLYNVAAHPINTGVGLYNAVSSPVQTYNAISTSVVNTWNSGLQGQGQIVGNVLIAAGSIGVGTTMGSVRLAGISDTIANASTDASYAQSLLYYEIGQKTLPTADYLANYAEIANPVDRGAQIVADQGWLGALTPQSSGWALGLGKTFGTDPTPLGWFGVAGVGAASQAGQLGSTGNNSSTGK